MTTVAICGIVTDAQKDNLNLVFAARGLGPSTFSRKLCAVDANATYETPATHWLYWASAGTTDEVVTLHDMEGGILPTLPDGVAWGQNGVISAVDALAACALSVFSVYSAASDTDATDFLLGMIDAQTGQRTGGLLPSRGLQFVPDPPL